MNGLVVVVGAGNVVAAGEGAGRAADTAAILGRVSTSHAPSFRMAARASLNVAPRKTGTSRFRLAALDRIELPVDADDVSWPSQCERPARFNQ